MINTSHIIPFISFLFIRKNSVFTNVSVLFINLSVKKYIALLYQSKYKQNRPLCIPESRKK